MSEESLKQENKFLKEMIRTYYQPEIERLKSIIKEVRELLKNDYYEDGSFQNEEKVFELLDKGE